MRGRKVRVISRNESRNSCRCAGVADGAKALKSMNSVPKLHTVLLSRLSISTTGRRRSRSPMRNSRVRLMSKRKSPGPLCPHCAGDRKVLKGIESRKGHCRLTCLSKDVHLQSRPGYRSVAKSPKILKLLGIRSTIGVKRHHGGSLCWSTIIVRPVNNRTLLIIRRSL